MSSTAPYHPVPVPPATPRRVRFGAIAGPAGIVFVVMGVAFTFFGGLMTWAFLGGSTGGGSAPPAFLPLIFLAVGLAFLYFALRGMARRRRLYVWGQSVTGKVVSVSESGTVVNGRRLLTTRYSFETPSGPIEGSMDYQMAPPQGAEVSVLFDPADPRVNTLAVPGAFGPESA